MGGDPARQFSSHAPHYQDCFFLAYAPRFFDASWPPTGEKAAKSELAFTQAHKRLYIASAGAAGLLLLLLANLHRAGGGHALM